MNWLTANKTVSYVHQPEFYSSVMLWIPVFWDWSFSCFCNWKHTHYWSIVMLRTPEIIVFSLELKLPDMVRSRAETKSKQPLAEVCSESVCCHHKQRFSLKELASLQFSLPLITHPQTTQHGWFLLPFHDCWQVECGLCSFPTQELKYQSCW